MTDPDPGERPSLTSIAYRQLKGAIINCELPPGTKITERKLARELDLGLTPVREALSRLATERLVTTRPRSGYLVTPLTERAVDELFELWRYVCAAMAELALRNGTDEQLAAITERLATTRHKSAEGPVGEVAQGERLFDAFGQAAGNARLLALYQQLAAEIGRLFVLAFREDTERLTSARRTDRALAKAVRNRDTTAIREHVLAFNDATHELVRKVLREQPSLTAAETNGSEGVG